MWCRDFVATESQLPTGVPTGSLPPPPVQGPPPPPSVPSKLDIDEKIFVLVKFACTRYE